VASSATGFAVHPWIHAAPTSTRRAADVLREAATADAGAGLEDDDLDPCVGEEARRDQTRDSSADHDDAPRGTGDLRDLRGRAPAGCEHHRQR
jgi:hypothetical protein